ncbi:hypothetical protein MN608_07342 [Microdochium nivale]|nr:hypothetical protein MN608_07342 [Microdochium nivale]
MTTLRSNTGIYYHNNNCITKSIPTGPKDPHDAWDLEDGSQQEEEEESRPKLSRHILQPQHPHIRLMRPRGLTEKSFWNFSPPSWRLWFGEGGHLDQKPKGKKVEKQSAPIHQRPHTTLICSSRY